MRQLASIIDELIKLNISIQVEGDGLKINGSKENLTHDIISKIKENKSELLEYLRSTASGNYLISNIPKLGENKDYVLSSAQRRLWVLSQFEEGSIAYNIPGTYNFEGELNLHVFYASFAQLISRHEILRTVFKEDAQGDVRQVILAPGQVELKVGYQDLRGQGLDGKALDKLINADINIPFDLSHGPLLRASLYQLEDQQWVFSYVMHHIISDGWSMEVLIGELLSFYNAGLKGEPVLLQPLSIQYKDYAAWQQEQLHGEQLAVHQAYWLEQFSGDLPVLELVNEYPRPLVKSYHGGVIERALDPRVLEGIRGLSQQQGGTLFMGLLSGVTALLYRYSGQHDIVIGSPVAGREHADLDGQIGFYLNTLAFRMQFEGNQSYRELLSHVREVTLGGYAHQVYPFDELVDALSLKRDFSRNVLFDVLIDYHDLRTVGSRQQRELEGLQVSGYQGSASQVSKFDLTFMFIESEAGLRLLLEYNSDLYSSSRAEQLFSHLEGLLLSAISFPLQALSQLSYLNSSEQAQLLGPLGSGGEGVAYRPVLSLFAEQVNAHPDGIAVVDGDVSLSYAELDRRSGELAAELVKSYGVSSGSLVGIMQDRSIALVISILGVLKSGGAYVPVDPVYPAPRKEYIMGDTGLTVLLTQTDYIFDLDYYSGQVFAVDAQLEGLSGGAVLHQDNLSTDPAYVIYTSGSTGQPKGCTLSHGNLSHYIQWANNYYFKQGVTDSSLEKAAVGNFGLYTSLSFDLTVTSIFCALSLGSSLRVYAQQGELTEILRDSFSSASGIDSIKLTPSHINLLQHLELESSSMLCAIVGGEAVSAAQVAILKKINPAIRIYNEYGPTETTVGCVVKELELGENVLIGRPISGMSVYLTDSSGGLVPVGVAGEICIAGDGVGSGYLNRAELSASKFIPNPFRAGERMYRSGDLGRWTSSGDLEFLGRSDEQVKIRGYRIELGEVESQLQGYGELSEAVVLALPGSGGDQELVAYLVSESVLDISSLRSYLGGLLPAYLIPSHFVQVDAIPLTSNGKADRKQLAAAGGLSLDSGTAYIAPRNVTEEQVAQIWAEVLEKAQVGIRDDFFDLGGDSIKILRMMAGLRRELGVEVPIAEVYRNSTIEGLMAHIGSHEQELAEGQVRHQGEEAAIRAELEELKGRILSELEDGSNIEDVYPMSDIEKGMVFESLVSKNKGVYHDLKVFQRMFFDFDAERFRYALELLVEKHTILRTSFHLERFEREVQMVHRKIVVKLDYRDLSELERNFQEYQVRSYLEEEIGRPFEVTAAPLWRMAAFNFGKGELIFVFQCHHAIIDGWSETSFVTELNNLYLQLGETPDYRPAALASDYKDFIVAHELDKRNVQIRDFWQHELTGASRLDLFTGESQHQNYSISLDVQHLTTLKSIAQQLNTNVKVISLTAYLYLLKVLSYSDEVVAGLVTNTRPVGEDSARILGCFLNTIPLRIEIDKKVNGTNLIKEVHEKLLVLKDKERLSTLEIARQHHIGMEAGNPFFDVIFNYVDFHVFNSMQEDSHHNKEEISAVDLDSQVQGNTYFDFTIDTTGGFYNIGVSLTRKLKSGLTAEKIAGLYQLILEHIIYLPQTALHDVKYINQAETDQLLPLVNYTNIGYSKDETIVSLFEEQVFRTPDKVALLFEEKAITYKELNEQSNLLAHYLKNHYHIQNDDLIGIKLARNEWLIISMLAVLKAGGAYVPIDLDYPQERIDYMLSDSDCKILLEESVLENYRKQEKSGQIKNHEIRSKTSDLAYVIYTSGSTGLPKGVMIEHRNSCEFIKWCQNEFQTSNFETVFGVTSICFDLSVFEIFYTLCSGKELRLLNNALSIPQYLQASNKVLLNIVPTVMSTLLQENVDLSSVNVINMAGEPIPAKILKGIDAEKIEVRNLYGPSEDTTYSTMCRLRNGMDIMIGKPISNTEIYIVNESLGLQPIGLTGEICIGGTGLARGYLNNPELTAEKFVGNPFRPGRKMYKTGDLGRWCKDGNIEFLGRKDGQVKIRGYRIELGEIENCLQSNPAIHAAVVTVVVHPAGENQLIAYLVSEEQFNTGDLRTYLNKTLPVYMLPDYFVQLEQLPLMPNGKIDRKNLPAPQSISIAARAEYLAPRNEVEQKIALIWEEILGRENIGVRDNFFESGGHSLKVIQLMSRISKVFELELNLNVLFNNPTIESLANEIENTYWADNELLEVDNIDDTENFSI